MITPVEITPVWHYVALTHPGRIHRQNQDAILIEDAVRQGTWRATGQLASGALVAIADGVSISAAPARAAREVLTGLKVSYAKDPQAHPRTHAALIHNHLCRCANPHQQGMPPAATLVAAILRTREVTVLHSGDSRAYLIEGKEARQLTRDHTALQRMLDEGEITPEQAQNAASIYSALDECFVADPYGDPPRVATTEICMTDEAKLLLCSDGVTEYLSDADLARLFSAGTSLVQAADTLLEEVLKCGGEDNISVVVMQTSGHCQ